MTDIGFKPAKKFDPNNLIDTVINKLDLKNDEGIARLLKVATPIIDHVRNRRLPVGGYMLIRLGEVTGMSVCDLKALMGDRRTRCRMPGARPPRSR